MSASEQGQFGAPGAPGGGQGVSGEGSGFVIDTEGHIVTNAHVVDGASSITVRFSDGSQADASLVGSDTSSDLAVIDVNVDASKLHPLSLGASDGLRIGQGVVAIGSPFGLQGTVTTGIISALDRTIDAPNGYSIPGAIQTDAAINHGNSGGPLLNAQGEVIGVNAQIASDSGGNDGVGFAIPVDTVKNVAGQLVEGGNVSHAYLGVSVTTVDAGAAETSGPAAGCAGQLGGRGQPGRRRRPRRLGLGRRPARAGRRRHHGDRRRGRQDRAGPHRGGRGPQGGRRRHARRGA